MKKSFSILILFSFIVLSSAAQNLNQLTGSLLWKVSGKDLTQPSYILGTHHLASITFMDSISGLNEVWESIEQVVGEISLTDKVALQKQLQQVAMLPAGENYHSLLSEQDYSDLDQGLKQVLGAGLDQLGMFKPGILSTLYSITLYAKLYPDFNPITHEGIDAYVQRWGQENNKSIIGLETIEDQIYVLLDAEPQKTQAEILVCNIRNSENEKELTDSLNTYYKKGQLAEMYNLSISSMNDPCPISLYFKNVILKDRNDKWILQLPQIISQKPSLIAVGALHLGGKEGLLYQLSELGYTVEPFKQP